MFEEKRTSVSERWVDFAAYVTWLALVGLTLLDVWIASASPRSLIGALASGGTVALGLLHRRHRAMARELSWRWGSVALQTGLALCALYALEENTIAVFLIIIASSVAESRNRQAAGLWLVLTNLGLAGIFAATLHPLGAAINFLLFLGFQLFAFGMSRAVTRERQTREQLAGVNAELLATRRLLQESARNEERLRISRELHDVAGHRLTALKLNLRALVELGRPSSERLTTCLDLSDELLTDIRSVVHQLRASDEIDVPGALKLLEHQHPGVDIELDVDPNIRIDGIELAEALVRSTQEAITNALKHGRAQRVWIALRRREGLIQLEVRDDGRGGAQQTSGHGLKGMSERAEILGGGLEIVPGEPQGWTVRLTLPGTAA